MIRLFISFLIFSCSNIAYAATDGNSYEILKACDRARGNLGGVTWTVEVEALEDGKSSSRTILVKSQGFDMFAKTLAPPVRKGYLLLQVEGNMWFFKPDLSKPVPVSQRQKLLGLAVNGDIASTNYAEDYEILAQGETTLEGQPCYLFDLQATSRAATYARIKYWVRKDLHVGIRAEFYTTGGAKLLKSAEMSYGNRIRVDDREQPFISRMLIRDELMSENRTTLNFSEPEIGPIPAHVFNINLLRK